MPELPEVTVISEDVAELAVGREVLRAAVFRPDVTNVEPKEFGRRLVARSVLPTSSLPNSPGSTLVTSGLKTAARRTSRPTASSATFSEMTVTSGNSGIYDLPRSVST